MLSVCPWGKTSSLTKHATSSTSIAITSTSWVAVTTDLITGELITMWACSLTQNLKRRPS